MAGFAAAAGAKKAAASAGSSSSGAASKKPLATGAAGSGAAAAKKLGGGKAKGKAGAGAKKGKKVEEAEAAPDPAAVEAARLKALEEIEAAREAAREQEWKERQAQREEIEQAIIMEERRVREKERKKREKEAAEKKRQQAFIEAAFEGEHDKVQKQLGAWIEECFGAPLIGAKLDCEDEHKHTPLSEAACGGHVPICKLLLKHGAAVNSLNDQGRTPLWRASFGGFAEVVALLLEHGADPRIMSKSNESAEMICPSAEAKAKLQEAAADEAALEERISRREAALAEQWVPPPPDPADQPIGQAGYSLQLGVQRLADALDSITRDSDRFTLIVDLGEKASTFFRYRDCNYAMAYKPDDIEPEKLRKSVLGALRYGKPFLLDMLSLELSEASLNALLDPVLPGLLALLLSKEILKEDNYAKLVHARDGDEYKVGAWKERNLDYFHFVVLTRLPVPPEWVSESFFVLKVA